MAADRARRLAVIGVYHETNTFSPLPTNTAAFEPRWHRGAELITAFEGTRTVVGGFLDGAASAGYGVVPVFGAYATPSGIVTREAMEAILAALEQELSRADAVDGVLLELHGDLVAEDFDDAEEEVARLVRRRFGDSPIACVLDLHANMSRRRFDDLEVLVGYRTNPHVDTYETGHRAVRILDRVIREELRPYRAFAGLAFVAPPPAQSTDDEPLQSLWHHADLLEQVHGIDDVTIHAGYAFGDVPYTGMGFEATADLEQRDLADRAVEELLERARAALPRFHGQLLATVDAVRAAVAVRGPVVIADTGDNINGGSPGDTTWLYTEALNEPGSRFLGTIADPSALDRIRSLHVGDEIEIEVGGRASGTSGPPLKGRARLVAISDGRFHNTGPMAHGSLVSMDGAAWIRLANLDLVVQGRPVQPNDRNLFGSLGILPEGYDVLILKGASALRASWSSMAVRFILAATLGETDASPGRLQYRKARLEYPARPGTASADGASDNEGAAQ